MEKDKTFKVYTKLLHDTISDNISLEDIGIFTLLGCLVKESGEKGKYLLKKEAMKVYFKRENLPLKFINDFNLKMEKAEGGILISFKNWDKYQNENKNYEHVRAYRERMKQPINWENCTTDLQRLICHYIKTEMPALYQNATQGQATEIFKRYGRDASSILKVAGSVDIAIKSYYKSRNWFKGKGLAWNLSSVARNIGEFVALVLKENEKRGTEHHGINE